MTSEKTKKVGLVVEDFKKNREIFIAFIRKIDPTWFNLDKLLTIPQAEAETLEVLRQCMPEKGKVVNECGAVGCIGGWGFTCPEFVTWFSRYFVIDEAGQYVEYPTFIDLSAWLGLSTDCSKRLFATRQCRNIPEQEEVLQRLQELINMPYSGNGHSFNVGHLEGESYGYDD